jgi:glutathione S-transferase
MTQTIGILDSYAHRTLVWDMYVERVARPATGMPSDEARIAAALPKAEACLSALATLMGDAPWIAGPTLSLGDLHAAAMIAVFLLAPEGNLLLRQEARLMRWWEHVSTRQSFVRTQVPPRHATS